MDPAGVPALIDAIRQVHGCEATYLATVHVHERTPVTRATVWKGDVEVFSLSGHASALRAYAWSEATAGTKRRFFAVLHAGPVTDAAQAVWSILADALAKTHAN